MAERQAAARSALDRPNLADELKDLIKRTEISLETFRQMGLVPETEKKLKRFYRVQTVAKMTGFSRTKIENARMALGIEPHRSPETGKLLGITLEQVNQIRGHIGARPWRQPDEECVRLAIQSFKGGVAKSVTAVYLAQALAEKGYRILLIDCDPQASATSSFGYIPDDVFDEDDTLSPFLRGNERSLRYAIRKTYFDGIHIVPSCLDLMDVDFKLFTGAIETEGEERVRFYHRLSKAIGSVEQDYDVVILDSAPNLSMMSINIMVAANAVIIPTPPMLYDFSSTYQYIYMLYDVIRNIAADKSYHFVKVLASKVDRSRKKQIWFLERMTDNYARFMLNNPLYLASAITDTATEFQTVYDQQRPDYRIRTMLDNVFTEVEDEIRKVWPSHHDALRLKGVMKG